MKILSFNTHSLHGGETEESAEVSELCSIIEAEKPDLIALQEVNQSISAPDADLSFTEGYYRAATCVSPVPFKADNFLLSVVWRLNLNNIAYHFTWLPVKKGYGKYDEGLAILAKKPIRTACGVYLSDIQDYGNWKTRMALLCEIEGREDLFCCLHTSRYDDPEEPFLPQWKKFTEYTKNRKRVIAAGDLNVPAENRGEGYNEILKTGFFDLYPLSDEKNGYSYTVRGNIDGWSAADTPKKTTDTRRIDFILSSKEPNAKKITYSTLFDGERGRPVSDHFGIMVDIDGETDDNTEIMKRREW